MTIDPRAAYLAQKRNLEALDAAIVRQGLQDNPDVARFFAARAIRMLNQKAAAMRAETRIRQEGTR